MNKPILSAEQAKALEALRNEWKDDESYGRRQLVKEKLNGGWSDSDLDSANSIDDDDFLASLYIGYEVEPSPEEKLREYYEDLRDSSEGSIYWTRSEGVLTTLQILGIKIEGVNA